MHAKESKGSDGSKWFPFAKAQGSDFLPRETKNHFATTVFMLRPKPSKRLIASSGKHSAFGFRIRVEAFD